MKREFDEHNQRIPKNMQNAQIRFIATRISGDSQTLAALAEIYLLRDITTIINNTKIIIGMRVASVNLYGQPSSVSNESVIGSNTKCRSKILQSPIMSCIKYKFGAISGNHAQHITNNVTYHAISTFYDEGTVKRNPAQNYEQLDNYRQLFHNLNEVLAEHDSSDRDHHVAVLIKHLEVSNHPECHHHLLEQYTLMVYNGLYI
uniref:Uncharacterized protein n=1 Tax=Glossina austeni TaxID=7395 RepID=A0A1A9VI58_GLOAU